MTLLKPISAILLLAMATSSSSLPPCGVGVRGRHYGANINIQPSEALSRGSAPWKPDGRKVERSPEKVHQNGDDYFDPDFKNEETPNGRDESSLLRENSSRPNIPTFRQASSSGPYLRRRRPGHLSASPRHRNEGEYGYNYQGGTGDVQIHQHIHEYRFNDGTKACRKSGQSCNGDDSCCAGNKCNGGNPLSGIVCEAA